MKNTAAYQSMYRPPTIPPSPQSPLSPPLPPPLPRTSV